jgi:VWFA-related protein
MRIAVTIAVAGLASVLLAQEPQTPRFRVAVDAVRIDAVVTDKDGNIVRDLTADDFEILQDKKPQKVTFAQFVPVSVTPAAAVAAAPLKSSNVVGAPPLPGAMPVRRENIQRTIALVVDDLGMSVESLSYVKRGLRDFIDKSMQPGDLVALVRTGGSMDGLQPFTTDRRVLHAAVDNLKWNAFSRSGVEAFAPVNMFPVLTPVVPTGPDGSSSVQTGTGVGDFSSLDSLRNNVIAAGSIGALNLVIEGARTLPGRKALLFVSEGFALLEKGAGDTFALPGRARSALDRAVDQATRAGVVIYSVDARGLQTGGLTAGDDFNCATDCAPVFDSLIRDQQSSRNKQRSETQEGMKFLAEQTGGFAILNDNNLGKALARVAADVRDYYVIGYAPEADTFAAKGKTPEFHKIDVRVKRPGLKVRTRKEFFGVSDVDESAAPETPAQQLVNAAISPFTSTDIVMRATTLPGFDASQGLFVRALLHIDTTSLTFTKGADGKSAAAADVLGMVFDRDGTEVAHLSTGFEVTLTPEAVQDALHDGLAYTLRIPIRRAGPYQVRFAVRDRASGKFGTAGEFLDLPDVPHGAFAISGIVLRSKDDLVTPADADRMVVSPSQAIRVYKPGEQLKYACEIYNAAAPVQLALSVWRGAQRVLASPPDTLIPPAAGSGPTTSFAAGGAFKLGDALPPGRYVLQLAAQSGDPAHPEKKGSIARAVQQMDFEVK